MIVLVEELIPMAVESAIALNSIRNLFILVEVEESTNPELPVLFMGKLCELTSY